MILPISICSALVETKASTWFFEFIMVKTNLTESYQTLLKILIFSYAHSYPYFKKSKWEREIVCRLAKSLWELS